MKRNRRIYFGVLVFNVILFCLFSNWFLLLLSVAMVLMPVCLILFMKQDIRNTEIAISIKGGWRVDQKSILRVELKKRHGFVAAGLMDLTLQLENLKFKEKKFFEIRFPISSSNRVFEIEYIPKLCGVVELSCTKAISYDVLGLVDLSIKKPETKSITVYPKKVAIQLEKRNDAGTIQDGDQYEKNKKGMDMSDIYDMREYIPGDNIRRVHWKLSSKLDNMVIREGSDTSYYDTILLMDIGLNNQEKAYEKELLSTAYETGMAVSRSLLLIGIQHCLCVSQQSGISVFELTNESGYLKMQEETLQMPIPNQNGMGFYYAISQDIENKYTKLIYLTVGEWHQELLQIGGKMDVTVISIVEGDGEIRMTEERRCQIIELPVQHINHHTHSISI